MAGRVLINGTDIREYGAYLLEGSYASMLVFPSVRNVVANDWHEEDGVEVDLSGAALTSRPIALRFGVSGAGRWSGFIAFLNEQGFSHTVEIENLGVAMELRYIGVDGFQSVCDGSLAIFTVRYSDDALSGFKTAEISDIDGTAAGGRYRYDGVSFGAYGVTVLGITDEVRKPAALKAPFVYIVPSKDGAVYDTEDVVRQTGKTINVSCLMRAGSGEDFSRNYWGLFALLHKEQVSELWDTDLDRRLPVYFTGGRFGTVKADGTVWATCVLSFVVTGK